MAEQQRLRLNIKPAIYRWQAKHGRRLTHAELAEMTGISTATIDRLVGDKVQEVDLHKLYLICNALECNPGDIIIMPKPE